jgi:hypothetical protein
MRSEKAPDGAQFTEDGRFWWDAKERQWVLNDPNEIEMELGGDPNPGSYPVASFADVRTAVRIELGTRLHKYQTQVLDAVIAFQAHADRHINELSDHHADVDFSPVVSALGGAMRMIFPSSKELSTFAGLLNLDSQLVDAVKHAQDTTAAAKTRLKSSLDALVEGYIQHSSEAWKASEAKLDDLVEEVLPDLDEKTVTTRPGYIGNVCDYAGVPDPVATGVEQTVRQQLEAEFVGVFERVRAEMYNDRIDTYGMKVNVNQVVRETVEEERKLYKEEGTRAWEHTYEEIEQGL